MPKSFEVKAMVNLVHYLEIDEQVNWNENNKPLKHVYQDVMVLKRYLIELKAKSKKKL